MYYKKQFTTERAKKAYIDLLLKKLAEEAGKGGLSDEIFNEEIRTSATDSITAPHKKEKSLKRFMDDSPREQFEQWLDYYRRFQERKKIAPDDMMKYMAHTD